MDDTESCCSLFKLLAASCVAWLIITHGCRYIGYLFFQLKTHKAMFNPEEEEEEEPAMSLTAAVIGLSGVTVIVAISAE